MSREAFAEAVSGIKSKYPDPCSALLPALHRAQEEFGWLSPEALESVADVLSMSKAFVRGVATFHSMYRVNPQGRHLIALCTNVSCAVCGSEDLLRVLRERYSLEPGFTSPDGRFSLIEMECIGACDGSPAMLVNEDEHVNLTPDSIIEILEQYK